MFCFALLSFIFLPHQCRWPISNAFGFCLGLLSFPLEVRSLNFWNGTISKCNTDIFFLKRGLFFIWNVLWKSPYGCFLCCGCIYSPQQWPSAISAPLWFSRGLSSGVHCWSSFSSALLPHPKLTKPSCVRSPIPHLGQRMSWLFGTNVNTALLHCSCVCGRDQETLAAV